MGIGTQRFSSVVLASVHLFLCWALSASFLLISGCSTAPSSISDEPKRIWIPPLLSDEQAHGIAIHALGLVGTPYRYGGNTPDGGFDCSGLIGYVYRNQMGTAPPRTVAQLGDWGQSVTNAQLRTGDLVIFGTRRKPTHAGIYVGEGRFVHAPSAGGEVRMDRLNAPYWSRQNTSFRRI